MSVATFAQELKVFSAEDNYSTPVIASVSYSNQNHGRITWSGDGKWLAVGPIDKGSTPVPVFKYVNKQLQPLKYITLSNISSLSFFNWTNRNMAVGNEKGEVFVWDIKEKKIAVKVEYVESQSVDFIAVNSDDSYLASGSLTSNRICLHGLKSNKVVNTISVPKSNHTSSLKFCLSKKNFLGASSIESTVCVWDIIRSEFVFKALNSHSGACTDISFSPINFEVIASVSLTKTLKMYDLREGKLVLNANLGEPLTSADIIFNGDKVALGTTGGSVLIYDLRSDKIINTFKAHESPILSVKTQNLKIPKCYQDVEMNTPDVVDKPTSKTLDLSVMDIFSPISNHIGKDDFNDHYSQSKIVSFHSTPKLIITNSESLPTYEDSFLRKVLSPLPQSSVLPLHSSPYLCPISEKPDSVTDNNISVSSNQLKEEPKSEFCNVSDVKSEVGGGDGFNVDNISQRNLYYSDIVSEIKNCQKEVLKEVSSIKKEVHDMKNEFNNKLRTLQECYENLSTIMLNDIKNGIYAGNCDSKIEHISQRILINELNESIIYNGEKVSEQIKLNANRLERIYEFLSRIK